MKKRLLLIFLLMLPCLVKSQEIGIEELESVLDTLDEVIEKKAYYESERLVRVERLKKELHNIDFLSKSEDSKSKIYWSLYKEYNRVQSDSASHYLDLLESLETVKSDSKMHSRLLISRAETYGVIGMYVAALDELGKVDANSLPDELRAQYYHTCRTIYGWLSDYSMDSSKSRYYNEKTQCYRDSILATDSSRISRNIVLADKMLVEGDADGSLHLSLSDLPKADGMMLRYLYMNISEAYKHLGKRISQKYYLCKAAIEDLKFGVKEYMALPELANLLFEDGDIERAYTYLSRSMEDASYCHARLRAIEISSIYPIIDKSYKTSELKLRLRERLLIFFLIGLVLALCVILLYLRKKKRQLSIARQELIEANSSLAAWNRELSATDKLKEEYIAHYLSLCRGYLDASQKYRRSLLKLCKSKSYDELQKRLSSSDMMDQEEERFYKDFDESFLNIHPNFVDRFNELLQDDKRIELRRNELLNTELRIFALIRLGVSDTNSIARLLNYSVATVYNYRSRMRNNSKYRKEEFEKMVEGI